MKILLKFILILQIGVLSAQQTQSEMILGTWRFDEECDFRTEQEKSEYVEVTVTPIVTENGTGYPDRKFKRNGEFEFYYNSNHTDFGKYELKKNKLIIIRRISKETAESKKKVVEWTLERNLMEKKEDGFYYFKPQDLELKLLTENQIEFGTEKHYTIWRQLK